MRTVFKYPIPATGDVRIELPMNAKLVLCDTQGASFNPVLWFEIERDNDHEMRTFRVFGTGHDIPDGYEHMGSVNHEMTGLVWHVYEKSDTETRRWSDDLTDRERIIANTSPDGLWAAASLRSEVSEPLYVCNKCGFSGTTSPHRGCNYFAAPAPSEGIETPPSDVMTRLANLGIDSDDLIGTIRSLRADLEAANKVVEAADEVWKSAEVFRFIGFNGYVVPAQKMLDAHAALASYRRSPDSNPQENNNER
jgi:hypothetical protein